jgi:hypothetical protein
LPSSCSAWRFSSRPRCDDRRPSRAVNVGTRRAMSTPTTTGDGERSVEERHRSSPFGPALAAASPQSSPRWRSAARCLEPLSSASCSVSDPQRSHRSRPEQTQPNPSPPTMVARSPTRRRRVHHSVHRGALAAPVAPESTHHHLRLVPTGHRGRHLRSPRQRRVLNERTSAPGSCSDSQRTTPAELRAVRASRSDRKLSGDRRSRRG